jgi:hypothetical protein
MFFVSGSGRTGLKGGKGIRELPDLSGCQYHGYRRFLENTKIRTYL